MDILFYNHLRRVPNIVEKQLLGNSKPDIIKQYLTKTEEFKNHTKVNKIYKEVLGRYADLDGIKAYKYLDEEEIRKILKKSREYLGKKEKTFIFKVPDILQTKEYILAKKSEFALVIVETRQHPNFKNVILNLLDHLNCEEFCLYVFHSFENETFVKQFQNIRNIKFIKEDWGQLISFNEYNNILTSERFWNTIESEKIVIFQCDSLVLRTGLERYLGFDYIGAPWGDKRVGNGGFSIRSKSKMLKILETCERPYWENEDVFFSRNCYKLGFNVAPFHIAKTFSVESVNNENPLAIHQAWVFFKEYEKFGHFT
jgi:hypothetical protein